MKNSCEFYERTLKTPRSAPRNITYLDCRQFLLVHVAFPWLLSFEYLHDTLHWKSSWCFVLFSMFLGHRQSCRWKRKSWIYLFLSLDLPSISLWKMLSHLCQFSFCFLKFSMIFYIRLNLGVFGYPPQFRRFSDGRCLCFRNVPINRKHLQLQNAPPSTVYNIERAHIFDICPALIWCNFH